MASGNRRLTMRYNTTTEICDVCGKIFKGTPINVHGSYEYINHTNFSFNIRVLFGRTKELTGEERVNAIVKEFFTNGNEKLSKTDAIEFLECFRHYKYSDKELLQKVFKKIQEKIDIMK
jgi:hypothetical protein